MNLNTLWIQHLPKEERESFKQAVLAESRNVALRRLRDLISNKRLIIENEECNTINYNQTNWAYLQAHNNGARQMLKMLEDMLSFVE